MLPPMRTTCALLAAAVIVPGCTAPNPLYDVDGVPVDDPIVRVQGASVDGQAPAPPDAGSPAPADLAPLAMADRALAPDLARTADLTAPAPDLTATADLARCGALFEGCCPGNTCERPARCLVNGECGRQAAIRCVVPADCGLGGLPPCDDRGQPAIGGRCVAGAQLFRDRCWGCGG